MRYTVFFPLLSYLFPVPCSLFPKTRNSVLTQVKTAVLMFT
ncbi:hypothetical protein [Moorena sp. SIO3H5]|nr:hypothetical protein [Moorena sp. SIO3H5]